jgi:hypothetical protein
MADDGFDYGELGEVFWLENARQCGADVRQAQYAAARFRGCSQTESARISGYGSENEASTRQAGYRLARSNTVQRLLAFAAAEKGGGYDGNVDEQEAKRILSNLARGSDPAIRIRAVESLNKMAEAERQARNSQQESTPEEVAREILKTCPEYGCVVLSDAHFQNGGTLFGLPYLAGLAPRLKRDFFPAWTRYLAAITRQDHRAELEKMADAPVLPIDQVLGPDPVEIKKSEEVAQ